MSIRRHDLARRVFGAGIAATLLVGALAGTAGAARSGPAITNVVIDGNCRMTMTYSATGAKLGEVDLYAQTWGYTSSTDTVGGYDIWGGFTSQPAAMNHGSADVTFQLATGGRLKKLTYYGWLYGKAVGTYKPGTLTPYYEVMSTCVIADYLFTVKFHDGYTSGDAGLIAADQQRVTYGSLITEPPAPTRPDWVFMGWKAYDYGYLGPNPAGMWDFGVDRMRDYDPLVLIAQWEPYCNPNLGCVLPG